MLQLQNFFSDLVNSYITMDSRKCIKDEKNEKPYCFKMFSYDQVKPITKKRKIPFPRSGHRIVCDNKNLYSFGGYNPLTQRQTGFNNEDEAAIVNMFPLFQELWKFNIATKQWKRFKDRESLPKELASNAVIRIGNYFLVYGGTGAPFGTTCSNQLYLCSLNDEDGKMFIVETTGKVPPPQYGQALICHNNYLYTIGGTTGFTYTCDIHRLNMDTNVWEEEYICRGLTPDEPEGRYRHEVAFNGSEIYILGGGTSDTVYNLNQIPVYNLNKKRWSKPITYPDPKMEVNGTPEARSCHGAIQIENQVFISGGFDCEKAFNDLWKLNLSNMQWTFIDTCILPSPLYFHSMSVTPEGKMYIFGGITLKADVKRTNAIHSAWLCIPKLSEMCWEAMLHYHPSLVLYSKKDLLKIGLPRHFINRI